jgi:hypothetical protein
MWTAAGWRSRATQGITTHAVAMKIIGAAVRDVQAAKITPTGYAGAAASRYMRATLCEYIGILALVALVVTIGAEVRPRRIIRPGKMSIHRFARAVWRTG